MENVSNPDGTLAVNTDAKPAETLTEKRITEHISRTVKAAIEGGDLSVLSVAPDSICKKAVKQLKPTDFLTGIEELITTAVNEKDLKKLRELPSCSPGTDLKPLLTTLLVSSAIKEDWECVRILIQKGADINNDSYQSLLITAIMQKNTENIKFLIENGANPNFICMSNDGEPITPLKLAFDQGSEENIRILIDKLIESDDAFKSFPDTKETPLTLAIMKGYMGIAKLLIEKADLKILNAGDNFGRTPLMLAIMNGHEEIIKLLMKKGKDNSTFLLNTLNTFDIYGDTAFMLAAKGGEKIFLTLIRALSYRYFFSLDFFSEYFYGKAKGPTPLMLAVQYGYKTAVELLIQEAKSDCMTFCKLCDKNGDNVFSLVAKSKDGEKNFLMLIQALQKAGVTIKNINEARSKGKDQIKNKNSECGGRTPFLLAIECGHIKVVEWMIKESNSFLDELLSDFDAVDDHDVLSLALKSKNEEMIKLLIKSTEPERLKYFLESTYEGGDTIFKCAERSGENILQVFKQTLVMAGVNPNKYLQAAPSTTPPPAISPVIEKLVTGAVKNNNPKALESYLIFSSLDIKNLKPLLTKLLLIAAQKGRWECARLLIEYGAEVNLNCDINKGNFNRTPLMQAIIQENAEMVKFLIKHGADVTVKYKINDNSESVSDDESVCSDTPFTFALHQGNKEIIQTLINIPDIEGQTPLMLAAKNANDEVVKLLIKQADPVLLNKLFSARDKNGDTVFTLAAMNGKNYIVEMLIQALIEADINPNKFLNAQNNKGQTPLMLAAKLQYGETVKVLLMKAGVDCNVKDYEGRTAIMHAVANQRRNNVTTLERYGANFSDILQEFVNEIAHAKEIGDVSKKEIAGQNFLIWALTYEKNKEVEKFIKQADSALLNKLVSACNNNGDTLFTLAAMNGRKNIVHILIQALIKADMNPNEYLNVQNKNGQTPLILAATIGHTDILKLLLEAGVDRNVKDHEGWTAIMHAAYSQRWKDVDMLDRFGANFSDIHYVLASEIAKHAIEIEKDGLTSLAHNLIAHRASLGTASKINKIKKWAHIWGIAGSFTIKDENGGETTFPLEGSYSQFMLKELINYISSFYKTNLSSNPILKDRQMEIQTSIEEALFDSSSSSNIQIQSGETFNPLVLLGGWSKHAISMLIYHNPKDKRAELMICNRGEGASFDHEARKKDNRFEKDYRFVKVNRYCFYEKHINKSTIDQLIKIHDNMKQFYEIIDKIAKPLPNNNFVQKQQKIGHCGWANLKGMIALILGAATAQSEEELLKIIAANKEITAWTRAEALRELLASNPDSSFVFLFVEKYFNKLFGKLIPFGESSIPLKEIIKTIESSEASLQDRQRNINILISALEQEMKGSTRPGIQDIGGQLKIWLTQLSSQISEGEGSES